MHDLVRIELRERLLERDGEQEAGEDLRAGLEHPQLLQQRVPVAIEPLGLRLVAAVARDRVPLVPAVPLRLHGRTGYLG